MECWHNRLALPLMMPISLSSKSAKSWDCAAMAIAMKNRESGGLWVREHGLEKGCWQEALTSDSWDNPKTQKAAAMMTRAIGTRSTKKSKPSICLSAKSHWQINGGGVPGAKSETMSMSMSTSRQETAIAIKFIYLFLCLAVGSFLICAQRST